MRNPASLRERQRRPWYGSATRRIRAVMEIERSVVVSAIQNGDTPALEIRYDRWAAALDAIYYNVGIQFASYDHAVMTGVEIDTTAFRKQADDDKRRTVSRWANFIRGYSAGEIYRRASGIIDTTRKKIVQLVEDADDIAQAVTGVNDSYERDMESRAPQIATIVAAASNLGILAARHVLGITNKTWMAVMDDVTRDTHRDAHNQTVRTSEPFIVGGFELMFPGDTSRGAPLSEVINCRCTVE